MARRIKHIQDRREDQDHDQGLHAADQRAEAHLGDPHADKQEQRQDPIGQKGLGAEQRHDVNQHHHQLGARVQPVGQGAAREILSQGDVLQHSAPPPFSLCSCSFKASVV